MSPHTVILRRGDIYDAQRLVHWAMLLQASLMRLGRNWPVSLGWLSRSYLERIASDGRFRVALVPEDDVEL